MKRRLGVDVKHVGVDLVKLNKMVTSEKFSDLIPIENRQPISIIITAWQTQDYIEECLDSIEKQTYFKDYDDYEILVGVDACEKTLNKLMKIRHKYRNLRIFMMKTNKGTYVTSNTLLDLVSFKNIIRFDSDDVMLYSMINEIMLYIEKGDVIKFMYNNFSYKNVYNKKSAYSGGVIFYKKKIIEEFGGYMPWICAADGELLQRFINNDVNIYSLNKSLFLRRRHNNSLTMKNITSMNSKLRKKYHLLRKTSNKNIKKIEREINNYIEK